MLEILDNLNSCFFCTFLLATEDLFKIKNNRFEHVIIDNYVEHYKFQYVKNKNHLGINIFCIYWKF